MRKTTAWSDVCGSKPAAAGARRIAARRSERFDPTRGHTYIVRSLARKRRASGADKRTAARRNYGAAE